VQLDRVGWRWEWGCGWECRGRNQVAFHSVFSHCVVVHHRSNSGTLRPSDDDDDDSFTSSAASVAELLTPGGSADQHLADRSCQHLARNFI
jgi:hypothetical protein